MKKSALVFNYLSIVFILAVAVVTSAWADDCVIKQNDNLSTYVFDNQELNVNTSVPPDSLITFPIVGEINVLGLTTNQLAATLMEKLSYYLKDPKVSVFVTAYNPLNVYLLGAFRNPGAIPYKPGDRLTDYISEAGGFAPKANLKKCWIYPLNRQEDKREINLEELLEDTENEIAIDLQPFDTVYIPEKSGFLFTDWRDIADAVSIAVGLLTLYIVLQRE